MAKQPTCRACPRCGSADFHYVKPSTFVYFRKDRLCAKCPTYYSPPTPILATLLFIFGGLLLALPGGFALFMILSSGSRDVCGISISLFLGVLGAMCFFQGCRYALSRQIEPASLGKAVPPVPVPVIPIEADEEVL